MKKSILVTMTMCLCIAMQAQTREHTRLAIRQGIGAEMIANRKFAAADCGLPMRWTTLTGKGVAIDDSTAYTGKHAVRLEGGCGIWQQHDRLTFEKEREMRQIKK